MITAILLSCGLITKFRENANHLALSFLIIISCLTRESAVVFWSILDHAGARE
jgi:hypothetical protein